MPTECPYCGSEVVLTTNDALYGRKFWNNGTCNIYLCFACKASVGTHGDGTTPLGRMANRELKQLKKHAHSLFDPLWEPDRTRRSLMYKWLAGKLKIPTKECHFGWFDEPMLEKAIAILEAARRKA